MLMNENELNTICELLPEPVLHKRTSMGRGKQLTSGISLLHQLTAVAYEKNRVHSEISRRKLRKADN